VHLNYIDKELGEGVEMIKKISEFINASLKVKAGISVMTVGLIILGVSIYSNSVNSADNVKNKNISVASESDTVGEKKDVNVANETAKDVDSSEVNSQDLVKADVNEDVKEDTEEVVVTKSSTEEAKETVEVKTQTKTQTKTQAKTSVKAPVVKAPVKAPVVKAISSGFKNDILNEFYAAFHETASTFTRYNGVKYSEFNGYLKAVASGQMSKSACVSKIKGIGKWEETIALPYQTEKINRTIYPSSSFDSHHVIVYETTETNGGKIGGYMYQNGLLTTGDYYQCSIYYDANIKKYRVALIGIPLLYKTRID
jgi:hypothetical protein